jgi:hypothetical protein
MSTFFAKVSSVIGMTAIILTNIVENKSQHISNKFGSLMDEM